MPDTGAPWEIPYLDGTELVRAYPAFSEDLADAIADGLDAAGNAGIGSNVVQTVKTDPFVASSTAFSTVTGMTATITPSSASSKILVIAQVTGVAHSVVNTHGGHMRIAGGNAGAYIGNADGSATRAVVTVSRTANWIPTQTMLSLMAVYLDSPNTSNPVTYSVQVANTADGTFYVNRPQDSGTDNLRGRGASSLTVIEVAP